MNVHTNTHPHAHSCAQVTRTHSVQPQHSLRSNPTQHYLAQSLTSTHHTPFHTAVGSWAPSSKQFLFEVRLLPPADACEPAESKLRTYAEGEVCVRERCNSGRRRAQPDEPKHASGPCNNPARTKWESNLCLFRKFQQSCHPRPAFGNRRAATTARA